MTPYRVFSQSEGTVLEFDRWRQQAARFFHLSLDREKVDGDELLVTSEGTRRVRGRERDDADLREALEAENRTGFTGLYDLAVRCPTIWEIERTTADDRLALRLAAIAASTLLGPILTPEPFELFGVRTARAKLGET